MANHKTGAQRYNDRMDKIFKRSEELGNHTLHGSTEKRKEVAKKMVNGKKVTPKMEHAAEKTGFYKHGDPRFGDVYEK